MSKENLSVCIPSFSLLNCFSTKQRGKKISPKLSIAELKELDLPDVTINSVELSKNQKFVIVLGTISKEIEFELLIPEEWNVRFFMGGGGGFVSGIQNSMRNIINMGYATAGTNTGHEGHTLKADWAKYNMERQLNFGHLAIHRTAVVSKSIIKEYYGRYPEFNYFAGCSRGGGQALMEAQRYPEDFDGIIAGAPVIDWIENGNPPELIIASKYKDKKLVLSRPIYPYPSQIKYYGKGDPNVERSFIEKK